MEEEIIIIEEDDEQELIVVENDVEILAPSTQEKEVTPTTEQQIIVPDENVFALSKVKVNAIPDEYVLPSGTKEITSNGTYDVTEYESASVNVPAPLLGTKAITQNGTYNASDDNLEGYSSVVVETKQADLELEASYLSMIDDTLGANVTKLPEGLKAIGNYAFNRRTNLALKELPDEITTIGNYGFCYCSNLELEKLPSALTAINAYAFQNCAKIKIKSVPAGVTIIQGYTFQNCTNITEMTCYGNITEIGSYAFGGSSISKFVLPNITKVPKLQSYNIFNSTPIADGKGYIYLPDNFVENAKTTSNWSNYADQIKGISELV